MNICKKREQRNGIRDESLCFVLCDLLCHLKRNAQWIMASLSFLFTLCVVFVSDLTICQFNELSSSYLSVFPCTLGLSITAYAIIIGIHSDTLKKLLMEDEKKVKPYHVICASMIFNGLLQALTILLTIVYQLSNVPLLFYISTMVGCFSLIQIPDILLQLLGLRTFVLDENTNDKKNERA